MQLFRWGRSSVPQTFRPASYVVAAREGDHTVLLDPEHDQYYGLDEVGSRIWELLKQGMEFRDVLQRLREEYDAPDDVIERDARALLKDLAALHLVSAT